MPAAGGPTRCSSAASSKDRTWEPLQDDPETKQLLKAVAAGAATDRQLSKRSAVVKNALRQQQRQQQHRTASSGSVAQAVGRAAGAADCRFGQRQQTKAAEQLMLSACGLEALASEFPSFAGRHTSSGQVATGIGGGGDQSECWYPALLPGLPRRPKTSGAASTRLETRLYAAAHCKQRVTSGSHSKGHSQPTEQRQQQQQQQLQLQLQQQPVSSEVAAAAAAAAAATDAGRPVLAKVATAGVLCSSAVPLRSIVDDEEAAAAARSADSLMQTTPSSIRAAIQSGQCTLEYDMSETVKSDLSPATLLRKYHRDKGLHYGQIKLALSRNQILEGAAIRDVEESRSQTLERSQSLRLAGLRGSMPNMSFASADGVPPLQLPMPPVRSKLKGPLLVSGILHPGDESAGQAAGGASKARGGGPKEAPPDEPRELAAPAPNGGQSVSQDFVSWQQLLGPQRIPTVTKPPTTSVHAPSGAAGFSTNSISLPQRRHQSKLAGGALSGYSGGGTSGQAKATRRPDSCNRLEAEPRYADPLTGAPASVQTRLAELAALESETVRWEKAGGKTKKKGRERED